MHFLTFTWIIQSKILSSWSSWLSRCTSEHELVENGWDLKIMLRWCDNQCCILLWTMVDKMWGIISMMLIREHWEHQLWLISNNRNVNKTDSHPDNKYWDHHISFTNYGCISFLFHISMLKHMVSYEPQTAQYRWPILNRHLNLKNSSG